MAEAVLTSSSKVWMFRLSHSSCSCWEVFSPKSLPAVPPTSAAPLSIVAPPHGDVSLGLLRASLGVSTPSKGPSWHPILVDASFLRSSLSLAIHVDAVVPDDPAGLARSRGG